MLFNSFGFLLVFLPLSLGGFALASRFGASAAMAWLIACSLVFYALWDWGLVWFLVGSLAVNGLLGRWIAATEATPRLQMGILIAGVTANLIAMAVGRSLPFAPLGISFITFTQIGFLLDQRGAASRGGPLGYALLVVFFPHLTAGPILRSRDVMDQFADRRTWGLSAENFAVGSGMFLIGLLKKTLIADPLVAVVTPGFAEPGSLTLLPAWQTALAYSFQLYFDFSGYSDMAVGLARMLGVRFPVNFASPYKAQSVIEYWQRWHMTLTRFLMGTVYNPLALAVLRWRRARGWRTDRAAQRSIGGFTTMVLGPIVVTMALAGIWHGDGMTFLVFGLLHGVFLAVNHAWRIARPGGGSARWHSVLGRVLLTYVCVLVGSVVFRAATLGAAWDLLAGMFGSHGMTMIATDGRTLLRAGFHAAWLLGIGGIVWGMPNTQQIMEDAGSWLRWRPSMPWAVAAGCAASLGLLSLGGTSEFVYFQF